MNGAVDLLRLATDRSGGSARQWLDRVLTSLDGPILELRASGRPGQVRVSRLGASTEATLADADRLPVVSRAVGAVAAVMCLPAVEPLDALFGEVRRVLRPGGTLVTLVPSSHRALELHDRWRSARATRRALARALTGHPGFRHEVARDKLGWLFASADFAVLTDRREVFWVPVPNPAAARAVVAGLVPAGIWPSDVEPERLEQAEAALRGLAGPDARVPVPLRLLVGRR